MNVETQFRDNVDAALARIVDPMQPFLIEDAKLLVDRVKPVTNNFMRLPFIDTLDLTRTRFDGNQPVHKRLDVEHHRYGAAGYYTGNVRIINIGNDPELKPFYRYSYAETPNRELFALSTWLETDDVWHKSPFGRFFDVVRYCSPIQKPDRFFDGPDAQTAFAHLMGKPYMVQPFSRKNNPDAQPA